MGSIYRRTDHYCRTCKKRVGRKSDRTACEAAGHTVDARQSRVWWVKFTDRTGKVYAEASGKKHEDAKALLRKREGDIAHGKPVPPKLGKLSFEDAAKDLITDYRTNGKRSLPVVQRRIDKHLTPFFGGWKMVEITTPHVRAYIDERQTRDSVLVQKAQPVKPAKWKRGWGGRPRTLVPERPALPEVRRPASNAEINRELALLKRMFSLAIQAGTLAHKPHIPMLKEDNVRTGFFEPEQYESVMHHLPPEIGAVVTFAYITGWRIDSEVLPLKWRQIDFDGAEVRLDAGTTKNGKGRVFPFTTALRELLNERKAERDRLKKAGHIAQNVFVREVADEPKGEKKPKPIRSISKWFKAACIKAGCPGRIPHDLRRTAVRNLVRFGVPQSVAMKLTGHLTDSVFRRYDIVSEGDLREAARKLDLNPVFRKERTS